MNDGQKPNNNQKVVHFNKFQGSRKPYNNKGEHAKIAKVNETEQAFEAYEKTNIHINDSKWNLDSGCTSHMTPFADWMENMEEINSEVNLAGENNKIQVKGKGNIKVSTTTSEGKTNNLCIHNVLYVPELRSNLLSVSSLVKQGNKVIFTDEGASILNENNELVAEAEEVNRMYILSTKEKESLEESEAQCMTVGTNHSQDKKINKCELWHRRLGHVNSGYLSNMDKYGVVRGLDIGNQKFENCEPCIMGKLTRNSFHPISHEGTSTVLELLYMDLCGPMPETSLGGSRYVYVIVDSFSRRIFVDFLKTKDEAFESFVVFKNRRENETQKKIKQIRSDNGSEFINERFRKLFEEAGIHHQKTTYYTPESNGIVERTNRTLVEKARTLLIDSELPLKFWAEAVSTAAYTSNCTPTKHDPNKTPMEIWSGWKPSVKHFKVFGCISFYYIHKQYRNKLEPKAKRGVFVGYSRDRKAYRIFNIEENRIVEVRDAKFNEGAKGGLLVRKNPEEENGKSVNTLLGTNEYDLLQDDSQIEGYNNDENNMPDPNEDVRGEERRIGDNKEVIAERNKRIREENEAQLIAAGVRRSARIRDRKDHANLIIDETEPTSYEEVKGSLFEDEWKLAMDDEMNSLLNHKVWKLVKRDINMKVLKNKWIYTVKRNPDNTVYKRKARLVVTGYNGNGNATQEETFAPVMKMESFRAIIAIASHKRMLLRQYDVKTAYLYADIKEKKFMEQPKGYEDGRSETMVCELQKGLYGLAQSGKNWNEKITTELLKCGFKQLETEPCIFVKSDGDNLLILGLYVDDKIVIGTDDDYIDSVMGRLKDIFVMSENKKPKMFLGIEINENHSGIYLSQKNYIRSILNRFGLEDCNPTRTPGDPKQDLDVHTDSNPTDVTQYQEMIGSLMYLANGTRPDIAFHVSKLSQYLKEPKQIHLTAVKRVYRYLKGTENKSLFYDRQSGKLNASADASWSNKPDSKSYSGYIVKLHNSVISWKSKKQSLVALSTCEAELMAICESVREIMWITGVLTNLGLKEYVEIPIALCSDSKSAIQWINGIGNSGRTKHVNRKYHFVREECKKGNIQLIHERSEDMVSDFLTKSLCQMKIETCNLKVGLIDTHNA